MAIRFICWRPLWNTAVLRAPLTRLPTGCAWAKPRAGLGRTDPTAPGIKRPSKTFTFIPGTGAFANTCRARPPQLNATYDHPNSSPRPHRLAGRITDSRCDPDIPTSVIWFSLLFGAVFKTPSFLQLQSETRRRAWQDTVGYAKPISDDALAYTTERMT